MKTIIRLNDHWFHPISPLNESGCFAFYGPRTDYTLNKAERIKLHNNRKQNVKTWSRRQENNKKEQSREASANTNTSYMLVAHTHSIEVTFKTRERKIIGIVFSFTIRSNGRARHVAMRFEPLTKKKQRAENSNNNCSSRR